MTRSDRWCCVAMFCIATLLGSLMPVQLDAQQPPFLIFGAKATGGAAEVIKSTSNALWVSMQSVAAAFTITRDGITTTSTDGLIVSNTTPALVGTTVQMSPRIKLCGAAWNSVGAVSEADCWIIEDLPATVAGTTTSTLKFGASIAGGAFSYPFTMSNTGSFSAASIVATGNIQLGSAASLFFGARSSIKATADKLHQFVDQGDATGLELNGGTPTLGTCTGGSMTSGSHNTAGEVTGNTSSSCVINFGTPNFTNAPFCFINDETTLTAVRVSARSASSITVTGAVSGDAFQFFCIGRIGT